MKGRELSFKGYIFKPLLFKWDYTVVEGFTLSLPPKKKKKMGKVVRDNLYSDDAVKDTPNIVAKS